MFFYHITDIYDKPAWNGSTWPDHETFDCLFLRKLRDTSLKFSHDTEIGFKFPVTIFKQISSKFSNCFRTKAFLLDYIFPVRRRAAFDVCINLIPIPKPTIFLCQINNVLQPKLVKQLIPGDFVSPYTLKYFYELMRQRFVHNAKTSLF